MSTVSRKRKKTKPSKRLETMTEALSCSVRAIQDLGDAAQPSQLFDVWRNYLTHRPRRDRAEKLLGCKIVEALGWSIDAHDSDFVPAKKTAKDANQWLAAWDGRWSASHEPQRVALAIEAIDWCHRLPELSAFPSQTWIAMLEALCEFSRADSTEIRGAPLNVSGHQLLGVELPLALAWQFPEVERCASLANSSALRLSSNVVNLLDGEGMISGDDLEEFIQLAASWTRCFAMTKDLGGVKPSRDARVEFSSMVRNLLRMLRSDGRLSLAPLSSTSGPTTGSILRAALRISKNKKNRAIAQWRLDGEKVSQKKLSNDPAYHSEWSGMGILQSGWDPKSPRLTVDFSQPTMKVELQTQRRVIFSTALQPQITIDGVSIDGTGEQNGKRHSEWESLCWFTDEDADYLEVEQKLCRHWKLQRQFLMARQEGFLVICDHLIGPRGEVRLPQVDYQLTIPLTKNVQSSSDFETREGLIQKQPKRGRRSRKASPKREMKTKRNLAMILPLSLPEWRDDRRHGEFKIHQGSMHLHQTGRASAMSVPIFFDLDRRRISAPRTWRQLTVADSRRIVSQDEAVGFRIQAGTEQWLMYRSLIPPENRTLMGHNLFSEFLFARLRDGSIKTMVEIE